MKILFAAAILALPMVAQTSAPLNVAGKWEISGSVSGVDVMETCTFTQSAEGKIAGDCDVQGTKWSTTGTVKDGTATWSHSGKYNGSDYTITYSGKADDKGGVTGSMDVDPFNVSGSFTAQKSTK